MRLLITISFTFLCPVYQVSLPTLASEEDEFSLKNKRRQHPSDYSIIFIKEVEKSKF